MDIELMYKEIITNRNDEESKSLKEEAPLKLDKIKENFRLHIHEKNRKNGNQFLLLDDQIIQNLKDTKEKIYSILEKYKQVNSMSSSSPTLKNSETKGYTNILEFDNHVKKQQEIINFGLWMSDELMLFADY